jgi:hypothetical protein
MPWKECSVMDERLQFVVRRLAGEPMAELGREFGISARRPYRYANKLPLQVENYILNIKREHVRWGARKLPQRLIRRVLQDQDFGEKYYSCGAGSLWFRGAPRSPASSGAGTTLSLGKSPRDLWCTDHKGEFLLGNRAILLPANRHRSCQPLSALL